MKGARVSIRRIQYSLRCARGSQPDQSALKQATSNNCCTVQQVCWPAVASCGARDSFSCTTLQGNPIPMQPALHGSAPVWWNFTPLRLALCVCRALPLLRRLNNRRARQMKNADPVAPAPKAGAKGGKAKLAKQVGAPLRNAARLNLKHSRGHPLQGASMSSVPLQVQV